MNPEKKPNRVEIINQTTTVVTEIDGGENSGKETTRTVTQRINLIGLGEDFLRDYFGLKVQIDWPDERKGQIPPEQS